MNGARRSMTSKEENGQRTVNYDEANFFGTKDPPYCRKVYNKHIYGILFTELK